MQVIVNNTLKDEVNHKPLVSFQDRAFNYGDGCFTTMYALGTKIFLLNAHVARLVDDSKVLGITLCAAQLHEALDTFYQQTTLFDKNAYVIKILVSRGSGGRGYGLPKQPETSIYISVFASEHVSFGSPKLIGQTNSPTDTMHKVGIASIRLACQPMLAGLKHLNRLEQVLAKKELAEFNASSGTYNLDDCLLRDTNNRIIEASSANLFFLKDNIWCTPKLSNAGVNGIMRKALLAYFDKMGIAYSIDDFSLNDLKQSSSAFLTNAVKFISPVDCFVVNEMEPAQSYNELIQDRRAVESFLYEFYSFVENLEDTLRAYPQ